MAVLSERVSDLTASPVREMLAASLRPDVISFAGGLPADESFADLDLSLPPAALLQYGPSEGEPELRRRIADDLAGIGLDCPAERILVLSGSQQGIDLAAKLFVDRGAAVAVESPAYLAALQVFRFFGARLRPMELAAPGAGWQDGDAPALAYVTPTFQNPTGACWTLAERQAMAAACDAADVTLFEDDPYRDLAYDLCERRPIASLVRRASWIYQSSFSKSIAPGLRLGFLAASEDLFGFLVRLKQAADLHTSRLSQWIVLRHLEDPGRTARLTRVVARYRARRNAFASAMADHLTGLATWETPPGGLFFWARLPDVADTLSLAREAAARGVLFTPGDHFLPVPGTRCAAMRLNFSHADEATAARGLATIAELIARRG